MKVKKISHEKCVDIKPGMRPVSLTAFIGQSHIKTQLDTAIDSAKKRKSPI